MPRRHGSCPRGICSTLGCRPSSRCDLLRQNALCLSCQPRDSGGAIGAALSRQLRVTFLLPCWSFSFHAVSRCRRDAVQALPGPLTSRHRRKSSLKLEGHGLETASASHRRCTLSGIACWLRKPFRALLQLDRASAANCRSFAFAVPTFCIIVPFCVFICCLLGFSFSDLDVYKYLSGLFSLSPKLAAGYRAKSKSFFGFFLLLHV